MGTTYTTPRILAIWGLVPEEYVVGVVKLICYAKDKETDTIKWERILKLKLTTQ